MNIAGRRTTTRRPAVLGIAAAIVTWALVWSATTTAQETAPPMGPEQQAMMAAWQKAATPGPQHQQLAEHFVGTWNTRQSMWMDHNAPPMIETGKAVFTSILGGRQVRMDFNGSFMGQGFEGVGYSGYDNSGGKYTSSWMDNMSTAAMNSSGDYDVGSKTYTYAGQMPDMMKPGRTTPVRETVRIVDADNFVMQMFEPHDGKEVRTMQIDYTRVK